MLENLKPQWQNRSHPNSVICMICEVITGLGMCKDYQAVAIESQPTHYIAKNLRAERQLATPHGVRPYGLLMNAPHCDWKKVASSFAEPLRLIQSALIKIDVRMESCDL